MAGWTIPRIAAVTTLAVAMLVINVLPAVTGVLSRQLGLAPDVLGALGSAALLGSAVGTAGALAAVRYLSPRATVLCGLITFSLSNLAVCLAARPLTLILFSTGAGIGTGLAASACYYVFGLEAQERNSAAGSLGQTAVATAVISAIPVLSRTYGWQAMYVCFAVLALPCVLLTLTFPRCYVRDDSTQSSRSGSGAGSSFWNLLSVALTGISIFMVWTYLDQMGVAVGVPQSSIDRALSLATVCGFVSSALVILAGRKVTTPAVLVTCIILDVAGTFGTGAATPGVYVTAVAVFYFSLPIFLAAQFAILMRGAQSKRFAVHYSLALQFAGLGPLIGGYLAQLLGFGTLRVVAVLLMVAALGILWMGIVRQHGDKLRASGVSV